MKKLKKRNVKIGIDEKEILDNVEKIDNIKILRQYPCGKYVVDGYCLEKNIVFEVDEYHHYRKGKLLRKDVIRQEEIEKMLNCKFVRIRSKQKVSTAIIPDNLLIEINTFCKINNISRRQFLELAIKRFLITRTKIVESTKYCGCGAQLTTDQEQRDGICRECI